MKAWIAPLAAAALLMAGPAAATRFEGWNAQTHGALIAGQPGQPSLYEAAAPGETLHPLLDDPAPLEWAGWAPRKGDVLVVARAGQLYTVAGGKLALLTDSKSHNRVGAWSHDGHWLAYASNRRNGVDDDLYIVDPRDPKSDRLAVQRMGAGWSVLDFTADGTSAVVAHRLSPARAALFFMDVASGAMRPIGKPGAYGDARFSYDGVLWATLAGRLGMIDFGSGLFTPIAPEKGGVGAFEVSLDGKRVAYEAAGTLKLLDTRTGQARAVPGLSAGVPGDLHFAPWGMLGFGVAGADVYSLDPATMAVTRWTATR